MFVKYEKFGNVLLTCTNHLINYSQEVYFVFEVNNVQKKTKKVLECKFNETDPANGHLIVHLTNDIF